MHTPKKGPREHVHLHNVHVVQAVADAVTSSVLQIQPSPLARLARSTETTTEITATGKLEKLTCMMATTKPVLMTICCQLVILLIKVLIN